MKNILQYASPIRILSGLAIGVSILVSTPKAQLPTGVTAKPIYDTTKAGLSFRKDRLPIVGMWEVPGKPKHFLVVGYFGYMWTLYPDTNAQGVAVDTTVSYGTVKKYTRTTVADFNTWVMKGWEFGALGGSFDPNFKTNRYFYVIYNKYPDPAQYRAGTPGTNSNNDGPNNPTAISVVDRYIMSADYKTVTRDTEVVRLFHGTGYGSANMVFGNDGMLYITADAYNLASWDSTITGRKILRIDVSKNDATSNDCVAGATPSNTTLPCGIYSVPTDNPWYNAANPAVRKEVYAFGFRNTYSLSFNYLTGALYGAETGQSRWEEINHILPGRNYGWNQGGDGSTFGSNSNGIEGPCHIGNALDSTSAGGGFTTGTNFTTPYSRTMTGTTYNGTYTCANFQNAAWYVGHSTNATDGLSNSAGATATGNVGNISPVIRGNPASPFYGYMLISDIAGVTGGSGNNFHAVKVDRDVPVKVGNFPTSYTFTGDHTHNGITTWAEDSYGNLYPILLSSRATGPEQWHDIFMLDHAQLTPLATPRAQVVTVGPVVSIQGQVGKSRTHGLIANAMAGSLLAVPKGYTNIELYNLMGRKVWSSKTSETQIRIPDGLGNGIMQVRFTP